jgi:aryl carrier-like protein
LRTALCGGEALGGELARGLTARVPRVWNVYGPTETTVWSTAGRVAGAVAGNAAIGSPLANTRIYVADRRTSILPAGIPGELLIGGHGVARGYLGRPEQTAERFVPDPFGGAGSRLYRTGDLARLRRDGTLEFLGRLDTQIKIRGFRVELGEVEAVLDRHPDVEQAVVVASGERLLAHYVARRELEPAELRALLAAALPAFMVPAALVAHPSLPLTPNGKVDRLALSRVQAPAAAALAPPQGELETLLAALWAELLGLVEVGRDDDFFTSGGHSILATVLLHRVRESFGVDLPLRALFAAPTLAGLAAAVAAAQSAPAGEPPEVSARADREITELTETGLSAESLERLLARVEAHAS